MSNTTNNIATINSNIKRRTLGKKIAELDNQRNLAMEAKRAAKNPVEYRTAIRTEFFIEREVRGLNEQLGALTVSV